MTNATRAKSAADLFRMDRASFLCEARDTAIYLCETRGSATVDDVRAYLGGIPAHIKPNIMATVFVRAIFEPMYYVRSSRSECGHRPIVRWKLKDV